MEEDNEKIIVKIVESPMYNWTCPSCGESVLSRHNPMGVNSDSCTFCGEMFYGKNFVTIING